MDKWLNYLTTPDFLLGVVIAGLAINIIGGLLSNRVGSFFGVINRRVKKNRETLIEYLATHPEKLQSERLKVIQYEIKATIYRVCILFALGFSHLKQLDQPDVFVWFSLLFLLLDIITSSEASDTRKVIEIVEKRLETLLH